MITFNIRYASAKDMENSWASRKQLVAHTLRGFDADLFGLQEAELRQIDDLQQLLPHYHYIGKGRGDGKQAGEFSPIFYNPKRFQLLQQETFWFSNTAEIPGSMHWGNFIPRICTWGRFKDLKNGKTFYLYNMHWDHASQTAREKSAQLLIKKITQQLHSKDPVIVMGDFNTGIGDTAYEYLLRSKDILLMDSFENSHQHPQGTFHGFSGKTDLPGIDAILITENIKIKSSSIVRNHQHNKYPSDHFPVTAVLKLH